LEKLEIEEWEQGRGAMPRLMCLVIKECNGLKMLPQELSSLNALREVEVSPSNSVLKKMLEVLQNDGDCIVVSLFNFPFRIRIGFSLFH
jgi:hypothetical protein